MLVMNGTVVVQLQLLGKESIGIFVKRRDDCRLPAIYVPRLEDVGV